MPVILFNISNKLYELLNNNIQQMHIHEEVPWQQIAVQSGMIECWAFTMSLQRLHCSVLPH